MDKWLWNLQPEPWMLKRWTKVVADDFMYVCSLSPGEQLILARNLSLGNIVLVDEGDGFAIYQAKRKLQ
jgi:23S rRNA A2030 N6-methylase RlmJ